MRNLFKLFRIKYLPCVVYELISEVLRNIVIVTQADFGSEIDSNRNYLAPILSGQVS